MIKPVWYWYGDKQEDQWNRIEYREKNPHTYGHLIFDKRSKYIQWKKTAFLINGSGSTGGQHAEKYILTHSYLLVKSSSPSNQGLTHKTRHTEAYRRKSGRES